MACPNMKDCALFPVFSSASFLKVWQINYCEGDYTSCARYELMCSGTTVASTLLPNGKHLPVVNNRSNRPE
jgi:hypothetical protein